MKPWEKYQQPVSKPMPAEAGPWNQYAETPEIQPMPSDYVPIPEPTPMPLESPSLIEKYARAGLRIPKTLLEALGGSGMKAILEPGKLEAEATALSGAAIEPVAGLAGLASLPVVGPEKAGEMISDIREAGTYQPRTVAGAAALQQAAENPVLQYATEELKGMETGLGELGYEAAGPVGGTIGATIPAAVMEIFGLKGLRSIRQGTRLLDEAGQPTKALRKALDKQGLIYEDLTPEARASIPPIADSSLGSGANLPKDFSEEALREQIKSGGRSDALAPLRISGEKVVIDKLGKEAMRQGFEPGIVQMVKTSTPETKSRMIQMVNRMRAIKKSASAARNRPSDIVGDSLTQRIKFIRDKADIARKKLNEIARLKLKGKAIDINQVNRALQEELDNLNIQVEMQNGIPKPIYEGSQISKNPNAHRAINDLIDLMAEGGKPDALRAHNLKRQLDELIDFNKKSSEGLTDAGRNVLKRMRSELNQSIRAVDKDYAAVNDTLAKSLDAFGQLDDAVGTIDIFGARSDAALGTRLRTLTSNYASRQKLENALEAIDNTVKDLGGNFNDNLYDLNMFANELDRRFGAVAKTSLAGQVEQATARAVREGPTRSMWEKGAEVAGKAAEKARGINDFNAFESLDALLKRQK